MTSTYFQIKLLTREDILFENSDVLVPVRTAVFMEEAYSVTEFMDDISYFAPECWTAYRQFLHFVPTATNTRSTTIKWKDQNRINKIQPLTLHLFSKNT